MGTYAWGGQDTFPLACAYGSNALRVLVAPSLPHPTVGCLAFSCHFNVIPVQRSLRDPSSASMLRVLQLALALTATVYAVVAVSGEQQAWQQACIATPLPVTLSESG